MTLMNRLKSIYANPNHKLISLIWLLAAFLCVIGVWHEASLLKIRPDVEGILMGMNVVAILSVLGSAYSVIFYGYRQTVKGILLPLLMYVLVYMAVREAGEQVMDEVAQNPEKWIMFVVGAVISRGIFKAWRGCGEVTSVPLSGKLESITSWPSGHQAQAQAGNLSSDEHAAELNDPR